MKEILNKMSNTVKTMTCKAHCAMTCACAHLSAPPCNTRGEGYIDTAIKILIVVVLGVLLLVGFYTLLGGAILPIAIERVEEMFDYEGRYPVQAFLFLTTLTAAFVVDCRRRTIPDFLCLLTAAAGLISFSPAQFSGVLAALPLSIAVLIRSEYMGGGDIKLTVAAGLALDFWREVWGMALGLLLAVLYLCTAMSSQRFIHHPLPAMTRATSPLGSFLSTGFAILYCFGG